MAGLTGARGAVAVITATSLLATLLKGCISVDLPEPKSEERPARSVTQPAPGLQETGARAAGQVPPVVDPPTHAGREATETPSPPLPADNLPPPTTRSPSHNARTAHALASEIALGMIGHPYRPGGDKPGGFDCSGLVRFSYARLGYVVPRDTSGLLSASEAVSNSDMRPGDLVFFHIRRRSYSHVGIYLGEGRFVHAPASGGVVRIEKLSLDYWAQRFGGARRLIRAADGRQVL